MTLTPKVKYSIIGSCVLGGAGCVGIYFMTKSPEEKNTHIPEVQDSQPKLPNKPEKKSYSGSLANTNSTEYTSTSAGSIFRDYLMNTEQVPEKWQEKKNKMNSNKPKSKLFNTAYINKSSDTTKLKEICKQMYTMNQPEWTKTTTGGVTNEEDRKNLWTETWDYCSSEEAKDNKPENWPYK